VLHFVRYGPLPLLASELRKRWAIFINPDATIRFGRGVICGPGFSLHIDGAGQFIVGDGVEFRREFRAEIAGDGRIVIGADCHMTYRVLMQCSTSITLGDRVQVGPGVHLYAATHPLDPALRAAGLELARPVRVGNNVWIGGGSILCPGVTVGDNSVIGAGSVVVKDVPANVLAVGNPCRVVRQL